MEEEKIIKVEQVSDDVEVRESEGAAHTGERVHTCNLYYKTFSTLSSVNSRPVICTDFSVYAEF